ERRGEHAGARLAGSERPSSPAPAPRAPHQPRTFVRGARRAHPTSPGHVCASSPRLLTSRRVSVTFLVATSGPPAANRSLAPEATDWLALLGRARPSRARTLRSVPSPRHSTVKFFPTMTGLPEKGGTRVAAKRAVKHSPTSVPWKGSETSAASVRPLFEYLTCTRPGPVGPSGSLQRGAARAASSSTAPTCSVSKG